MDLNELAKEYSENINRLKEASERYNRGEIDAKGMWDILDSHEAYARAFNVFIDYLEKQLKQLSGKNKGTMLN